MKIKELMALLTALDPEKSAVVQVIAEDGKVWNCWLDVNDVPGSAFVQIRIWHPDLKTLPS